MADEKGIVSSEVDPMLAGIGSAFGVVGKYFPAGFLLIFLFGGNIWYAFGLVILSTIISITCQILYNHNHPKKAKPITYKRRKRRVK